MGLRNGGSDPVRLEVTAHGWSQDPSGRMELSPAADLVVYPPVLALGPGEERNLRVGATARPGAAERSWRVFIQELPPAEKPGERPQVRVLSRIGIPVFLAPARAVSRAEVAGLALVAGKASFALRNTGAVRVRPTEIRLRGLGAGGEAVYERSLDAWYVLAGGERRYEEIVPPAECGRVRSLAVEVAFEKEVLRAAAEVPGGACAP